MIMIPALPFMFREKLFTLSHIAVLECVIELVACLAAVQADETAYRYALIASQCIVLQAGHPHLQRIKVRDICAIISQNLRMIRIYLYN